MVVEFFVWCYNGEKEILNFVYFLNFLIYLMFLYKVYVIDLNMICGYLMSSFVDCDGGKLEMVD